MEGGEIEKRRPVFRDIRRYYCEFCGICRSKKSLISSHIISHHQEELKVRDEAKDTNEETEGPDPKLKNRCEECGKTFQKPAHLKQHTQSHSLEIVLRFTLWIYGVREHWIPHKELQNARGSYMDLNGLVPGRGTS